jgi:CheY-like chemotaxis protein
MLGTEVSPPPLPEMQSRRQRTLLQVEDNPASAELVKQLIERRSDLSLLTATNGHQGIEMARAFVPDLILMDMMMPGLGGLAAIAILREDPVTAQIPVIVLSSNAYLDDIEKGLIAGVFRYLTKPYRFENLMAAIDAALPNP